MGFDRNTIIGFVLIGVLLIGMFVLNSRSRLAYEAEQLRIKDSIAQQMAKPDSIKVAQDHQVLDSVQVNNNTQGLAGSTDIQDVVLENDLVKIVLTNKGAQPKDVELKQFKTWDGQPLHLLAGNDNEFSYRFNAGINRTAESGKVLFNVGEVVKNADQSQSVTFTIGDSTGQVIQHIYTLKPNDYMLQLKIKLDGSNLVDRNELNVVWKAATPKVEKDSRYEETQTHVCYYNDNDYDYEYVGTGNKSLKFNTPTNWIVYKQQFFATGLIGAKPFESLQTTWEVGAADTTSDYITKSNTGLFAPINTDRTVDFSFYYGPSDYKILKKYNQHLENVVPYGSGVFAFVKYINRHFLLPIFDFLQQHIASMGIVILLLTFIIRLLISPILYKTYLSSAKMKALKPEVDALRAKFTDPKTKQFDQQAFGMEQMKLWRSAGVNPLGGCIPALLQLPIFMSLFYFFQSNVDLRGKSFLWTENLASYDSIYTLPFNIPFYGDHVSLFTLTAVITSLLISIYSMSGMQDNSNPMMKYMPYIFPVLLLGIFNNMPSALTWYYTVSNIITLLMQFVIQNYIIDHKKILAQINENMKKPVKKSKFQERLEQMQEQQKKLQEMKEKANKSK